MLSLQMHHHRSGHWIIETDKARIIGMAEIRY
ncbi:MAG: hypothetical protein J0665_15395 [Deltaproteobacteria bacterium]|nr:hypothetical protein [Deltaproteobacteria bacterium]